MQTSFELKIQMYKVFILQNFKCIKECLSVTQESITAIIWLQNTWNLFTLPHGSVSSFNFQHSKEIFPSKLSQNLASASEEKFLSRGVIMMTQVGLRRNYDVFTCISVPLLIVKEEFNFCVSSFLRVMIPV